jgi:hypothetical protein
MFSLQTEQELTDLKNEVTLLKQIELEKQDAIDQLAALISDLQQQLIDSKKLQPTSSVSQQVSASAVSSSTASSSLTDPNVPQTPLTTYAVNMLEKSQNSSASGAASTEQHYAREDELIEHVTYLRQAFCRFVKARDCVEMQVLYSLYVDCNLYLFIILICFFFSVCSILVG